MFSGRGKTTCWDVWLHHEETTEAFLELMQCQDNVSDEVTAQLQRFVVVLYDRASTKFDDNAARRALFTKWRSIENIPPTKHALEQHILRMVYQASYVGGQALEAMPIMPSPSDWGWRKDSSLWTPIWTPQGEVAQVCRQLVSCGCKNWMSGNTLQLS